MPMPPNGARGFQYQPRTPPSGLPSGRKTRVHLVKCPPRCPADARALPGRPRAAPTLGCCPRSPPTGPRCQHRSDHGQWNGCKRTSPSILRAHGYHPRSLSAGSRTPRLVHLLQQGGYLGSRRAGRGHASVLSSGSPTEHSHRRYSTAAASASPPRLRRWPFVRLGREAQARASPSRLRKPPHSPAWSGCWRGSSERSGSGDATAPRRPRPDRATPRPLSRFSPSSPCPRPRLHASDSTGSRRPPVRRAAPTEQQVGGLDPRPLHRRRPPTRQQNLWAHQWHHNPICRIGPTTADLSCLVRPPPPRPPQSAGSSAHPEPSTRGTSAAGPAAADPRCPDCCPTLRARLSPTIGHPSHPASQTARSSLPSAPAAGPRALPLCARASAGSPRRPEAGTPAAARCLRPVGPCAVRAGKSGERAGSPKQPSGSVTPPTTGCCCCQSPLRPQCLPKTQAPARLEMGGRSIARG
mmetsp:Transcript_14059/g.49503  ORF Transcript_14059/g.49503 Transcript_14059/m.49503 type:complete len:467 (+) Transcript_14059:724-2124(+)